jgi:hypothetical protein
MLLSLRRWTPRGFSRPLVADLTGLEAQGALQHFDYFFSHVTNFVVLADLFSSQTPAAAQALVDDDYLLAEDLPWVIAGAAQRYDVWCSPATGA